MRILLVSPGNNRKYGGGFYYAFHRRLANGLIREGHFVYPFSDRDTADYALGVRQIGRWLANRRLIETALELRPEIVLFLQCQIIEPDTLERLREAAPGVRLGVISIDDISHPTPTRQFRQLLERADFGFATTGGSTLAAFAGPQTVAFIPNPIDRSIDAFQSFARDRHDYDAIFTGHQPGVDRRWAFLDELIAKLPDSRRIGVFGRHQGEQLSGAAYVEALAASRIGLNLNRRDGDLYASDRMAHLLGNGLLVATHRASGYADHFSDDEMLFHDGVEDLAAGIENVLGGDRWRDMARAGAEKARATMSETLVARFMVALMTGEGAPADWTFSDHIFYGRGGRATPAVAADTPAVAERRSA